MNVWSAPGRACHDGGKPLTQRAPGFSIGQVAIAQGRWNNVTPEKPGEIVQCRTAARCSSRTSRRERDLTHLTELGRLVMPMLKQCYESAQPMALKKFRRSLGSMRLQYR
jgi:hypothetical protein